MTTTSYWQRTTNVTVKSDELPTTADVIVVGAGIVGVSTAYFLAKAGVRVALIEQGDQPASGASGRNGGFLTIGTAGGYTDAIKQLGRDAAKQVLTLSYRSRDLLRKIMSDDQFDGGYRMTGRTNFALTEKRRTEQTQALKDMQADGFTDSQWLTRKELAFVANTPLSEEIIGGTYNANDGVVHSGNFVRGLAQLAQKHGARVSLNTFAQSLNESASGVTVTTNRGTISANVALCALNAWSCETFPALKNIIVPVRGQVLSYAPIEPMLLCGMGVDATSTGEYWQQTIDGTILIGGCRAVAADKEVNLTEDGTTSEMQAAIEKVVPRLFPKLDNLKVNNRWSGRMAFTKDYTPVVDLAPNHKRVWVSGGFSGHGVPYGLPIGDAMARAFLGNTTPDDLFPFALSRASLR
jgi:glycine/D-amino acid oxidase-like deaminating enzyme